MEAKQTSAESPVETVYRGVTIKAVLVGLILSALMAVAIPYGDMIIKGSQMGIWNTNPGAIFLFFMLVSVGNVLLGLIHRELALDRGELVVVYIMLLIANTLPARGFAAYVMPIATGALYYASPENDWAEKVLPYLPDWATVQDEKAVRQYYEGLDQTGAGIPWDVWAGPIFFWMLFALSLYLVMISVSVILRKQWVERERLVYPMMQLPLHMLQQEERQELIPAFFKQPMMWLGFLLPFVINNVNALHHYFHYFPSISTSFGVVPLFRNSITIGFTLSFTVLGFSYLISRNIAAGLSFFYILNVVEQGMFRMLGIRIDPGPVGAFGHYAQGVIVYQAMGGMIVLVLIGLWNARSHLHDVFRKAFLGDEEVDDSEEMMSYRQAVFGGILGLAVMSAWLWRAGLPLIIVPVLLLSCFVLFLTITRVVVEGGVAVMFPSITGPDFTAAAVGTRMLGPHGGAAVAMTYVWGTDILLLLMTSCCNGLKLADQFLRRKRRLFWAIMGTIAITILVSLWVRLDAGYEHGAINLTRFYADNAAQYPYRFMEKVVSFPVGPHMDGWIQVGVGAAIMAGLEFVHYKFLWWPFHPLGFPISAAFGGMWFSLLLAFILKTLVLKYGGPTLYRRTIPFFLGMILGEIVPAGIWLVVDYFTGMNGNVLGTFMI
ncbi:MAG: hypothetical protein HOC74_21415 [Gemmatimonadetes bacterium]|nr:hypothetical protein [Gemmatimonadota bacterium]